ncbi:MAG TPA: hypothetical protein VGR30_11180 [Candidatus Binatia bacterium]|jgi:hypothetical protein|nr:hypothetical protein [Candidatus Binatia bacterium]
MNEYIAVDLGKRKVVVVKRDRRGKVTGLQYNMNLSTGGLN